ncbi:MAG: hypothetical protein CMO80_01535 [Verrucomicrobiales bacterium]|nr:hypothetical protein [Verrucomicrobiales bacterium]
MLELPARICRQLGSLPRRLGRRPRAQSLIISLKQLGDTVLLEPGISALAKEQGGPVYLHVKPGLDPLLELMPNTEAIADPTGRSFERVFCF